MKREGRQHGMVRTCRVLPSPWNPKPNSKVFNKLDSPPTAGLFNRVQTKPTNHSKFTGKCSKPRCVLCHFHPCCKSKDKIKGTLKLKSQDIVSNYKLVSWKVVNSQPGPSFHSFSSTAISNQLSIYDVDDELDDWIGASEYDYERETDAELDIHEIYDEMDS